MSFIDEQVVKMRFDNDGFEKGVSDTISSLEKLNQSVENLGSGSASSALQSIQHSLDQINFTSLNNAIDAVNDRFSTMGIAAARVIENLTDKVETLAENLVNALSVKSLSIGFGEYEQVMDISKVILANTKASNEEVQNAVRDLQAYADRTIFNYNDLTGVFGNWVTMAGSLEKAGVSMETAMEGLGNMVAMSGKGTGEMSRLGYAMSKVFSQGYMNRMTMMQFMRNGAMSTEFQKAVTDAVKKVGDYEKYLRAMTASGQDLYGAVSSQTAKGDSNWFTDEVLIEVLRSYTDTTDVRGKNASAAAENVMTPSQLVSITYEAMATGWSRVFESIFGDPEEARALLSHLSFILNGTDEIPGVLSGFFLNLGSFFEDWNMIGGREDAISGLFDAFEGLQNIVESVGLVFAEFFPGFSPEGLAELTSNFKEGASRFKDWTENLRASFGDYTRWDFWMEEVHEQTPKEERIEADADLVTATALSTIQSMYGNVIQSFIDQFNDPKYVKSVKDNSEAGYHYTKNESALNAAFKKYGNDANFVQWMQYWTGIATAEDINDAFYENGVKNDEHFDQLAKDQSELMAYIDILNENGIDGNALLQEISDNLAEVSTTYEDNRWFESHRKARVINQQEAGWQQQDFIDTLSGIFSILGTIRDVATSLYDYVVEPMLDMITSGAFMSALEILSGIGSHLFEFYQRIVNSGALDTFFGTISDFIFGNIDIGGFFADLTVTFLQLNNIIWDTINNVVDFFGAISQNETFQTVIGYLHTVWDLLAPFISNNLKTGGAIGGFLGALKGALSGFFMGGPIGMLIGAFKGFTGGAVKGGMFGILIDVLQYLEKNGPKVKYILGQVYDIVSGLFGSFVSGFTESGLLGGFSEFVNQVKQLFTDIKTGAKDPLDAIFGFLNSETVRSGIDTAKTKLKEFGLWVANGLKWVKDHIITAYDDLMQKWQSFEGENTDNPIVKFVQFITDENSVTGQLLSLFTNKIGALFEIFSALIDGLSEGSLSKAMDNLSDAKDEGSLKYWDEIFGVYYQWGTTFRSSDTFGIIKQGFFDLGSGIRSFISLVGNGTIPGIIFDIFSMVGKLGSSLINGIFGGNAPEQISEQAEQTGETVETGLKGIKQRLEAFINGADFASLQQRLYDLGLMFDGFLGETAAKFSEKFPDIANGIGKFIDIITDTNFYKTLSNLKDIIVDIAASFISGFTGTELVRTGDDVATTLETINTALTEFKADDKYKTILDFFKDVGDFIAGIPEAIGKISENIGSIFKQDSVPGILFNGLASILIPKEPEVAKDVNGEIQDTGNSIIDSIINGAGGVAGGIWEAITSVFTGHEVSAAELFPEETADAIKKATDEYKTSMDGVVTVTKEVQKQVSYGRDNQIEWQTGTATLNGAETVVEETTKVANEVNEKADETKEAAKNAQVFSNFGNGLNTFVHILGGLSTGAVVGGVIAIGIGLFSIFNAVGTITSLLGNMNILIIVKLINTVIVGLIAAVGSIMLLAYGLNKYQNGEVDKAIGVVQGLISFIGIVVLVMTLVNNLTNKGININVATNPFDALKAFVAKIGDAINTMASKIGTFAIVAAIIGGVLLITNAIEKLSKLDEDKLKTAGDIVNATTMILGAVAVLLTIFASGGSNKEGINITANLNPAILAAPILMLAYSIKLIIDSYTELVKVLSDKKADPEAIKISAIAVGGIMTALGVLMAIFAFTTPNGGNNAAGGLFESINNIKFDKFLTIGFALLAICEGVNLIIGAIGKLYNTVKNEKGTIDDSAIGFLAGAILSITLLILAMGQSMSLLGGENGKSTISGGTSVAMIAMVLAVKGLIEAISDLANTYKEDMGNGVSIGNILGSIATIIALMFSTGGSIGLMKDSKVNFGTSIAMVAMVWMIKELIQSIADLTKYYVTNINSWEDVAGLFGAIGTILGAMVALAGSMELMGDSSKKGAGFESAIAMVVMMISLWRIVETVKDLASDFNEGKIGNFLKALASIEAILWSLVGMVKVLTSGTEIGTVKTINTESFWALAGIVLAAVGSLWFLAENIKDPDKLLPISESLALIIGTFAGVTAAAQQIGKTAGLEKAGLKSIAMVALKIGGVISAIVAVVGAIGDMIDNHQKGSGIGSGFIGGGIASLFEGLGEGLLVAAEFIGKLAGKFREGYMVTDAETVSDSMSAIGAGAEELSAAVESVDPTHFLKIQEVLEAFDGFTTSMANFAMANNGVTLPVNMFENLGKDVQAFAPLFTGFCEEIASLDQTIESEYGIKNFGSTTLTDYFKAVTGLLSIEDTDAFDTAWGKTKFNGMKESFGDIKEGVIAFIEGCAAIDTKLSENKEKKADITSFDDYIQFVKDLAGIKFENYAGTGWFADMGQNLETLGGGLTTFVGSVEGLKENEGFNNALDIMTKLKTTFGDTDSQNIYDSLTNVGLGLDAFVQSANDAFGKNIYGTSGYMDNDFITEKMERIQLLTDLFGNLAWAIETINALDEDGANFILGLIGGIVSELTGVGEIGKETASTFIGGVEEEAVINSPSVAMFGIGVFLIQGLLDGIDAMQDPVESAGKSVFEIFANSFKESASNIGNLFGNAGTNLLKVFDKDGKVQNALSNVKTFFTKGIESGDFAKKLDAFKSRYGIKDDHILGSGDHVSKNAHGEDQIHKHAHENNIRRGKKDKTVEDIEAQYEADMKAAEEEWAKLEAATKTEKDMNDYEDWFGGEWANQIMETRDTVTKYGQSAADGVQDFIGMIAGDGTDKNSFITSLKDGILEGIVPSYDELLSTNLINKYGINKIIGNELFDSFFNNSIFSGLFTDSDVLENILFSSEDLNDLLSNITEALPGLDLSSLGLDDLASELQVFSDNAHYMGGDETSNKLLKRVDSILGLLDEKGNYIGEAASGAVSELSDVSGMLGSSGVTDFGEEELANLMEQYNSGAITADEFNKAIASMTKSSDDTAAAVSGVNKAIDNMPQVDPKITEMAYRVIRGEFGNNPDRQGLLEAAGYSYEVIQNEVNRLLGNGFRYQTTQADVDRTLQALGGATEKQAAVHEELSSAIMEIFDPKTGELISTICEGGIEIFENSKSEVNEAAASAGEEAANSYIDGFTNAFLGSGDHVSEIAHGEVVDKTNDKLGINSPSTEFFAMGEYCMMGFLNGFASYMSSVQGISGELSEAATSGLDEMQTYFTKLGDWMKSDAENPLDKFFTQFDNLYNMFTEMKDKNGQPFTIHPKVAPVLEMDSQTADLGQLMTGQALLTVNGIQIAGIDRIYELLERSINSSRDDSHAIITAIDATREELGTLKDAINGMQVTLDKKKLVGEIYTDINRMMGIDKNRAARGM